MKENNQTVIFLGTGTSQGIPIIGAKDPVSLSTNPKDKRLRSSVFIEYQGKKILIDCGPDFRMQMLRENLDDIDFILLTHEHNDHIIGLDDVRPINYLHNKDMPIYALQRVVDSVKERFPYAFIPHEYPGLPKFDLQPIEYSIQPINIQGVEVQPLPILHGKLPILGYRIGDFAYLTDVYAVHEETKRKLKDLTVVVIGALRQSKPHHSHLLLDQAIELAHEIGAQTTYFTHIGHEMGFYEEVEKILPPHMHLAYDGLKIKI
ncbi:MBL fold metallo-hydrolase [Ornithobacterium rhinotracheale]|uniref:MBL fold metallo-hydrolase n=1 Tax=Ornithobacterium rhinotracheale TaxID=28251 RepID=A0A3R5UW06_ORNRH|nr:MBL fold metallo-hydrolase [Ornithobacterium rhinotracheale]QAR29910.1 MBL fold metallo-hydrolase [Ornithobacterium rhinotracheale]